MNDVVLREAIVERIEAVKNVIEQYKTKESLIEADLTSVKHEVSIELLRNESDKMFRWQQAYQKEHVRLKKLLSRHDEGFEITQYELGI